MYMYIELEHQIVGMRMCSYTGKRYGMSLLIWFAKACVYMYHLHDAEFGRSPKSNIVVECTHIRYGCM